MSTESNPYYHKIYSLITEIDNLNHKSVNSSEFKVWKTNVTRALKNAFYPDDSYLKDFEEITFTRSMKSISTGNILENFNREIELSKQTFQEGLKQSNLLLTNFLDELPVKSNNVESISNVVTDSVSKIEQLFLRFHHVTEPLKDRRKNHTKFLLSDEYDVQDLLHAMLKIFFDDIRPEEWNPSYAGSSSKSDFLLEKEKIIIEVKKTRDGLDNKLLSQQLIVDKEYYRKNSKCNKMFVLVYDYPQWITNPRGFEASINEKSENFECKVFVIPRF